MNNKRKEIVLIQFNSKLIKSQRIPKALRVRLKINFIIIVNQFQKRNIKTKPRIYKEHIR